MVANLDRQQHALPLFIAERRRELIEHELSRLVAEQRRLDSEVAAADGALDALRAQEQDLALDIARSGGDRLNTIEADLQRLHRDIPARRSSFDRYNELLRNVGIDEVADRASFLRRQSEIASLSALLDEELVELDNRVVELRTRRERLAEEAASVNGELRSLQSRQSNLPMGSVSVREQLCADLSLDSEELPFVGELLQVRADARDWEGAAERVLRNFALSLLVPNEHYVAVAEWINRRHLGARVVYFRVPARVGDRQVPSRPSTLPILVDMIEVKPDTAFESWLRDQLARRADHVCVESVEQLRHLDKAITREGQVKSR